MAPFGSRTPKCHYCRKKIKSPDIPKYQPTAFGTVTVCPGCNKASGGVANPPKNVLRHPPKNNKPSKKANTWHGGGSL